ncbi:MAG: tripartite tricarboxylate transporter substrate-binding protein [Cypionkella sp.]
MTIRVSLRRSIVGLALVAGLTAGPALAFDPGQTECIAPANAGGGWDFSCRQVGKTLQDLKLVTGSMQVTNLAGGGGGVAFAEVVSKRNEDQNLIVAASTATATRLATNAFPGNTMDQVRWVGAVGADYGVIAVAKDSPINTLPELMDKIKADPSSVSIAGGSAVGGWDHLKVLITADKAGIEDLRSIKYVAFDGGGEAVTQLLAGSVQAFTGDASEAKGFVDSGDIKVIAVLAPQRMSGDFANFPTAKEQGIDAIGANWRGFYAPGGMSDEAFAFWQDAVGKVYASEEWKATMAQNGLAPLDVAPADFQAYVANSISEIQAISKEIGLIQ